MMKLMLKTFLCCLILMIANFADGGEARNKLKYVRDIEAKPGARGIAAVQLDKEIYENIGKFSDIRITDNIGNEIPFRINRKFTKRKGEVL